MKCLSIRQPWAWAILHAGKDSENRSWPCPQYLLGERVLVHASGTLDAGALEALGARRADMVKSAILGSVLIVGCDREMKSRWDFQGEYHFRLENPIAFERAIPLKGKLGFFDVPDHLLPEVR